MFPTGIPRKGSISQKSIFLDAKSVILKFFDVVAEHTFKQYDYMGILNWTEYQN